MNFKKIEEDIKNAADLDGDGKLTTNDLKIALKRFLAIIGDKVPNAAGFAAAYLLGLSGKILWGISGHSKFTSNYYPEIEKLIKYIHVSILILINVFFNNYKILC